MRQVKYYDVKESENLREMLNETVEKFGSKTAYFVKDENAVNYEPITYRQYKDDVEALGTAFIDMGLKDCKIAVIGENSYKWVTTYMATVNGVGCIVPLDKELPENEIENLLVRSGANAIIFSDKKRDAIYNISRRVGFIKYYISMSHAETENEILSFDDVLRKGKNLLDNGDTSFLNTEINNNAMNMLLFTSGTTSASKGVMLSHKNICSNIAGVQTLLKFDENDTFLSVLPIHHTYEATIGFLTPIFVGASVGFCEGLRYISKNLQELKPTIMPCVPAIVESIYKKAWESIEKAGKKEAVEAILAKGELGVEKAREIFKDIYEGLGGRLRMFLCGAAAVSAETIRGMRNFGVFTLQGYGLTETAPAVTLNQVENYKDPSIGLLLPSMEIKIVDKDEDGNGEIVVKGPNVMLGYYKDPAATAEVLKDGWFYTGDLGHLDEDGFVYITGRKKNVIILKNGKNIFPEELEVALNLSTYIKESMAYLKTENNDTTLAVSVYPDFEKINEKFGEISKKEIEEVIKDEVKKVNKKMVSYKAMQYVQIRDSEFAKTTSMKIKRYLA